ncbi:MAG: bifunctional (p)ppGpp synthetase/guanosine-3',5'-bis(diphosphate) 3'-pyrophosphohydrolase [Coxiellaceae bacterium]|nr:bifunctional (p)ppGpp synthetase/guanosine-3',5'-bis(diphosphate) 3'-pyrophosphohydrolase [Coxiellaceae bacterium]
MSTTQTWLEEIQHKYNQLDTAPLAALCTRLEEHPESVPISLDMANLLLEMNADQPLIEAALLYYIASNYSNNQMSKITSREVNKLIVGAHNLEQVEVLCDKAKPSRQGHADNLRKMLLAIVDDVRVVVLKLAEQLMRMKSLREASAIEQQSAAHIVSEIYAPLANRLGIGQLKWQLEDWTFRYSNPDEYQKLKKALNMRRQDREQYVDNTINDISQMITAEGVEKFDISGRAKHIYSIYKKINRKHVDFEEIYDAIAIRVLVNSLEECYKVLSSVHGRWEHIPQEFDDYVSNPKPNGYRSIHTAVIGPENKNVEIQIRTYTMHDEAELGVAAHWAYKEESSGASSYDEKINWLRQVMDWQREVSEETAPEGEKPSYENLFADRVYVFTPQGDIIDLPEGATPLDFAYYVHSDIGHRCRGAKVNGTMVPLTYKLKTGDHVSVQTNKENKPSRDWLNPENGYLQSPKARSKVAHWFRRQNYEDNIEKGQAIWEKLYRAKHLPKSALQTIYEHFNFKTVDSLLAALGSGDISSAALTQQIQSQSEANTTEDEANTELHTPSRPKKTNKSLKSPINIAGVDNLLSQLASCCKPIPGDPIIGYITQGRGVTIHRSDCHHMIGAQKTSPQRIVVVDWGDEAPGNFSVDLVIEVHERLGLVRDVTQLIAGEKIGLVGLHTQTGRKGAPSKISLTVEIDSLEPLNKLMRQIRELPDVINIERKQ